MNTGMPFLHLLRILYIMSAGDASFFPSSLLLDVFQAVKRDSRQNDDTFKDELQVCIDTEDGQGIGQCGEDQHTDHNTGDLTDTTGK